MPELPEVETVVRTLERQLYKDKIMGVEIRYPKIIEGDLEKFQNEIVGKVFTEFKRRGKYLHFIFEDDTELYVHLRMEGKFYIVPEYSETVNPHIHLVFQLQSGRYLCYQDTRKFGRFYYISDKRPLKEIDKLGYEPFDELLTGDIVWKMLKGYSGDLKSFLLDQTKICGIGNIYANEICYAMEKHPSVLTKKLTKKDADKLLSITRNILTNAIAAGGTTIRSYTSSLHVTGRFQLEVLVHGRDNQQCKRCGTIIVKEMLHQRGTYYCPKCQRRPRVK